MSDGSALPKPEKRKPLNRVQFATLILAQSGLCGCGCGKKLQADRIIDEHVIALDFLGSNDLSNRSLWDRDCSKAKTAKDLAAAAKGKRLRKETGNGPKRKIVSRNTFDRPSPLFKLVRSESSSKWGRAGAPKKSWGKRSFSSARKWPARGLKT